MHKYAEYGEPQCMVTYGIFIPKKGGSPEESGEPLKGKKRQTNRKERSTISKLGFSEPVVKLFG